VQQDVFRLNMLGSRWKRLAVGLGSALALLNTSEGSASAAEAAEAPPYPACTTSADEAALQAARGAFEAGKAAFNEADYARAIIYWEDAFRRDCSASLLLKNLSRAYEANGQLGHAVVALTTFLEREPNAVDRGELEAQIAGLKNRQAGPTPPAKEATPAGKTSPAKSTPAQAQATDTKAATNDTSTSNEDTYSSASEAHQSPSAVGPVVLASIGAAVAVTGGVLWWGARNDEIKAENECPSRMGCPVGVEEKGNDAIDGQLRWGLLAGGGLILLGGGVTWFLLQPSETTAFVPAIAPGYAGLSMNGRF
jgi:tetratricopeptide (TPR) repeat protein